MAFKVEIQEVVVTEAGNGPRKYKVADVVYSWNGNNRKQRIMSFANPDVFKTVTSLSIPASVAVETTKNAKGYEEWAKVVLSSDSSVSPVKTTGAPTKVVGSNYETPEERKFRQLLIVRQSSIANAIEFLKFDADRGDISVNLTLEVAQQFVDFVYGNEKMGTMDGIEQDIPE